MSVETRIELAGWRLVWLALERLADAQAEARLAARRARVTAELRERWTAAALGEDPVVAAMRRLFKSAGTDPGRYRPSSEALVRRLLKGEELPTIHPLVDLNNQLSIELRVPCCVVREGSFASPVTLRAGRAGEVLDAMRGPLELAGKPLLEDAAGPFGTPITDAHRVKVLPETRSALIVAYLPAELVAAGAVADRLDGILAEAPVAHRRGSAPRDDR